VAPGIGWSSTVLRRLRTIRATTSAAATIIVGIALVIGAAALIGALRHSLIDEVQEAGRAQAIKIARQLESGRPTVLDVTGSDDEQLVQVLGPDGSVVASSPNVTGEPAVAQVLPGQTRRVLTPLDDDEFVAVAEGSQTFDGPRTVLVARALVDVSDATAVVIRLLMIGLPVLLVVVALTTWFAVGRALAPVDAIRREVDGISAAQLHRRVPQPRGDDEIARLAATMNRMLARLENSRNSQRRFVSDASHELRSPLTTIREHSEVALAHPEGTTVTELADVVLAEELRMQRLVEDMLVLARTDEHAARPRAAVDLDDLVFEEATRLRSTTAVQVDTSAVGAARVHGDEAALRRVVRNLADNAARHAAARVDLALTEDGGEVRLTIDDDGPGIPESQRQRVLKRFVRLDEARSRHDGGSGLGLAIVDEVVRDHGGSVFIRQSPAGGARLEVRLPAGHG
jgi:signal transduction histidine kinase